MGHKLIHPESKQEIEVDAGSVPVYLSQGWTKKPRSTSSGTTPRTTTKKEEA